MKHRAEVEAELHAHALQLMRFCRERELGFILAIMDGEGTVERCTNINDAGLENVAATLLVEPTERSQHRTEERPQ